MTEKDYRAILENAYPRTVWPLILKTARDTYTAITDLSKKELNWLDGVQGRVAIGVNRAVLLEHNIKTLMETLLGGNYRCEYVPNSKRSHHHLEVYTKDTISTVCKVDSPNKLPSKEPLYRRKLCSNNHKQSVLDLFPHERIVMIEEDERTYLPITHSKNRFDNSLASLVIGVPDGDMNSWHYKVNLVYEVRPNEVIPKGQQEDIEKIVGENLMKWKKGQLKDAVNFSGDGDPDE